MGGERPVEGNKMLLAVCSDTGCWLAPSGVDWDGDPGIGPWGAQGWAVTGVPPADIVAMAMGSWA